MEKKYESNNLREVVFHLSKIVEGATNIDLEKTIAYTSHLQSLLEELGEFESAKRIGHILSRSKAKKLSISRSGIGSNLQLPVDTESRLSMADEELVALEESAIFLPDDLVNILEKFISYVGHADTLFAHGVGISPSLLLYGPPGCGKTQLARHLSARFKLPLITARMDGLISSYLGSTAKNLRHLFEYAASKPSVLFLDELDSLGKMRDDTRELGELKRVVISLLQNIDALNNEHIIIAATNHDHLLDPAIWRRFAYKMQLNLPTYDVRNSILQKFLGTFATDIQVSASSALSQGLSGAKLRQIAEDSIRDAIIGASERVSSESLLWNIIEANDTLVAPSQRAMPDLLKMIRATNPKLFTQSVLAELFGLSQSMVSKTFRHQGGQKA